MLFPAVLQGEKAIDSITFQLGRIAGIKHHFDAIAIIRGGGGDVGLNCYNQYELASMVARSPLPVITGIGHSTNETVTEMVAFKNAITATELADFLIRELHNFSVPVERARERICEKARGIIREENSGLRHTVRIFRMVTESIFSGNMNVLENARKTISYHSGIILNKKNAELGNLMDMMKKDLIQSFIKENTRTGHLEEKIKLLDPVNTLKRGYSITRQRGKTINSVKEIESGTVVETQVADGSFTSNVISKSNQDGRTD
jgi:exodeoxyribonuclease VII large subunit